MSEPETTHTGAWHGTDKSDAPLPEYYQWKGEGPAPAYWYAPDGTKVYRSYKDYCDD